MQVKLGIISRRIGVTNENKLWSFTSHKNWDGWVCLVGWTKNYTINKNLGSFTTYIKDLIEMRWACLTTQKALNLKVFCFLEFQDIPRFSKSFLEIYGEHQGPTRLLRTASVIPRSRWNTPGGGCLFSFGSGCNWPPKCPPQKKIKKNTPNNTSHHLYNDCFESKSHNEIWEKRLGIWAGCWANFGNHLYLAALLAARDH